MDATVAAHTEHLREDSTPRMHESQKPRCAHGNVACVDGAAAQIVHMGPYANSIPRVHG